MKFSKFQLQLIVLGSILTFYCLTASGAILGEIAEEASEGNSASATAESAAGPSKSGQSQVVETNTIKTTESGPTGGPSGLTAEPAASDRDDVINSLRNDHEGAPAPPHEPHPQVQQQVQERISNEDTLNPEEQLSVREKIKDHVAAVVFALIAGGIFAATWVLTGLFMTPDHKVQPLPNPLKLLKRLFSRAIDHGFSNADNAGNTTIGIVIKLLNVGANDYLRDNGVVSNSNVTDRWIVIPTSSQGNIVSDLVSFKNQATGKLIGQCDKCITDDTKFTVRASGNDTTAKGVPFNYFSFESLSKKYLKWPVNASGINKNDLSTWIVFVVDELQIQNQ